MAKTFKLVLFSILIVYAILFMAAFLAQEKLIFFPEKLPDNYEFRLRDNDEEVFLKTEDEETINGIYYSGENEQAVLYFHGNAGSLKDWQFVAEDFYSRGYSFLIIDYRAYGKSSGKLTEEGLYNDALAAYDFLEGKGFTSDNIIVYGRSIGTGVATELATRKPVRRLILESPFTSLTKLANQKMPFLLPTLILEFRFDNMAKLAKMDCPVVFIHGDRDSLIPFSHTEKLFEAAREQKKKVIIPGAGHNDINTFEKYHESLTEILDGFFKK